jgi:hypothetical protein
MATFQLTNNTDTFDLDTAGTVQKGGAAFGTWSTNSTNQMVISDTSGTTLAIDATWKFNADNHLVLQSGGSDVFDFCAQDDVTPFFKTVDAVLQVFPDQNNIFTFSLNGEWDIDNNHNLTFTAGGVTSTIDGFVQDPRGRFMYHFFDQDDLTRESILGFVGEWESFTDTDGKPMVRFKYKRADGTTDTFELPAAITLNRTINQFMYQYDKNGQTRRLQFVGELKINENFQITYSLDRQVSRGQEQVASTTFQFGATFHHNDFNGDIELAIQKNDGSAGGTTITVAGHFTAMLGTTQLMAGFSFSQIRNGATVTSTFGFNGTLRFKDSGEISWEFQRNATQMTININAQIQVGGARVDGRLNLVSDSGRVVGVKVLLGVAF